MIRVAIAGFQHETNTFGLTRAGFREFEMADSWPGLLRGADVVSGTAGINLPIAGFAAAARHDPEIALAPILWCAAEPSAHVTEDAFERIAGMILDGVRAAGPVDGIYLDLHGAMVTEHHEDGEGALLHRLRQQVGPDLPIVVSLDLHANITAAMVDLASALCIFRTYPHLDMAATGARCLEVMKGLLAGARPCKAFRQAPYLVPLSAQYTGAEPCSGLYGLVESLDRTPGAWADLALGFTAADIPDMGPSVVAYAAEQAEAEILAEQIMCVLEAAEHRFDRDLLTPAEAVRAAMQNPSTRPVVIADVQDNPGAGATSDTTGLMHALVAAGARGALLGLLCDPAMAGQAHSQGIGAVIEGALGGRSGVPGDAPFQGRFLVEALSDGICAYSGEMYGGSVAVLGPCAVLRVEDPAAEVRLVVSSQRSQCLDLALFTHIGLDPATARIVGVKSTVHFRADFEPIAARVISTAAPGAFPCRLEAIPYRRLRPGIRQ
ncbi:MAG: M81 family metallopeptidase [Pseudomonadota bacterium]